MRDLNPNSSQNRRILILLNHKTLGKSPKNPFIIIIIFTQMKKKKIFKNLLTHFFKYIFPRTLYYFFIY